MKNKLTIFLFIIFYTIVFSQKPYRGAEYRTIESYQYGRFEVRMKSSFGSGIVSSFFTINDYWAEGLSSTENWKEIDFETLGQHTNKIQTNIITAYETHHVELHTLLYNPHVGFHTYAFEWTPDYVSFYIDNQLVRHDNNNYVQTLDSGQKIMMNIWQPIYEDWVGPFDENILPVYAFYDWVKYYSYTPGSGNYGANNNFTLDWMDDFNYFNNDRWQKATHTWSANNAQFVQENAVLQSGYLILCLTDNTTSGYSGEPLSVSEKKNNDQNKTLIVYPNPFNSSFTIETPDYIKKEIKKINIVDITGKYVFSTNHFYNKNGILKVSLKNKLLPSGLYYGVLETEDKNHIFKLTYVQ
tara:strand:- start:397 stop:1461 length:1065 start_codon:yes stop_codon:yes gene_type:complete